MFHPRHFLFLHFLICAIGLITVFSAMASGIAWVVLPHAHPVFHPGMTLYVAPQKPVDILFYGVGVLGYFLYFSILWKVQPALETWISPGLKRFWEIPWLLWAYLGLLLLANLLFWQIKIRSSHLIGHIEWAIFKTVLWTALVCLPFYSSAHCLSFTTHPVYRFFTSSWTTRVFQGAMGLFVLYALVSLLAPWIGGPFRMANELMSVPEKTFLNGTWVDNTQYINAHHLVEYPKFDIARGLPAPTSDRYLHLPDSPFLRRFVQQHADAYAYDQAQQQLFINRAMTPEERKTLKWIYTDPGLQAQIEMLFIRSDDSLRPRSGAEAQEEALFLQKNWFEMNWQLLNRWVLHHHNFLLGSINEYALGRPAAQINMQYGWLNVVVLKSLLEATGGITYDNYFRVLFSFYPLYILLFIGFAWLIFRRLGYVLLALILMTSCLYLSNDLILATFLAPGLNPVRHFFDVFVMGAFYLYLLAAVSERASRYFWMFFTWLFLNLQILNNSLFGLFLVVSVALVVFLRGCLAPQAMRSSEKWLWGVGFALNLVLYKLGSFGKNDLLPYYFHGLATLPLSASASVLLVTCGLGYGVFLLLKPASSPLHYLYLALLFYFEGFLIYYFFDANVSAFYKLGTTVGVLAFVLLIPLMLEAWGKKTWASFLPGVNFLLLMALLLPGMQHYHKLYQQYTSIFKDHAVYTWNFPTAHFQSTMDPTYFQHDVAMIQHETTQPGIYLISRYDNVLPFLAKRYSAMPYPDLQWFLNTDKETLACIQQIQHDKPPVLFVDSDIQRAFLNEVIHPTNTDVAFGGPHGGYDESWARVHRLEELQKIYQAVQKEYILEEKGYLISVYRRKAASPLSGNL